MSDSIFSTYNTGENRVTASILAVLRSLSLFRIERLLGGLLEQDEFELVRFQNQPSSGGKGVPDAIITSSCRVLVETKIAKNAVGADQLKRHLKRLDEATETTKALLVVTPDTSVPPAIEALDDARLVWSSFERLYQGIDELLLDPAEVVSEREAFLLRELQAMLRAERLVGSADKVLVVAARHAWHDYERFSAYVCQANRSFQNVERMGFYSKNRIYPLVPKILAVKNEVQFAKDAHSGAIGMLVNAMLDAGARGDGDTYKVMLLSGPNDPETLKLAAPVVNDLKSGEGTTRAFTMGHRYVSIDRLKKATLTSQLCE